MNSIERGLIQTVDKISCTSQFYSGIFISDENISSHQTKDAKDLLSGALIFLYFMRV